MYSAWNYTLSLQINRVSLIVGFAPVLLGSPLLEADRAAVYVYSRAEDEITRPSLRQHYTQIPSIYYHTTCPRCIYGPGP